jgi:hypothetical protein
VTKTNVITFPDRLDNYNLKLLLFYPSKNTLDFIQAQVLPDLNQSLDLYIFNQAEYNKQEVEWLSCVFDKVHMAFIEIDSCEPFIRDLSSYFLGFDKTYWLTNADEIVYNHINNNRVYTLDFLNNIGGYSEKR